MFSALDSIGALHDKRFLDLYAGSGAVGLEAVSRGASHVLLVESDPKAARTVRANIAALRVGSVATISVGRVATMLASVSVDGGYDVVFADPPYGLEEADLTAVLAALVDRDWLNPDGIVIVERSKRSAEPAWVPPVTGERSRRYGDTMLWYGRRS